MSEAKRESEPQIGRDLKRKNEDYKRLWESLALMLGSDPTTQKTTTLIFSSWNTWDTFFSLSFSLLSFKTRQLLLRARCVIHQLFSQLIKDGRRQNVITVCSPLYKNYNYNVNGWKKPILKQRQCVKSSATCCVLTLQGVCFGAVFTALMYTVLKGS